MQLDHLMYATPTLDEGLTWAADVFGTQPSLGGSHQGLGTCNALLSLGSTYLELIAPDPKQSLHNNLGGVFADLSTGGLVTWAVAGNLTQIEAHLATVGIPCTGPKRTERITQTGETLIWDLLFTRKHRYGPRMPFFIDWLDCPHPSASAPGAGALRSLTLHTPRANELELALSPLADQVNIEEGEPMITADIQHQNTSIQLRSTAETAGITMG